MIRLMQVINISLNKRKIIFTCVSCPFLTLIFFEFSRPSTEKRLK